MLSSNAQADRFGEVVMPHLADALSLARWLTGNATDAEDVVQDACVKAHANIASYAGGNARAWLLTIVGNSCYTWLARNRPRSIVSVGDLGDLDEVSAAHAVDLIESESPEASLIAKADVAALEAAIAALPQPFRETLATPSGRQVLRYPSAPPPCGDAIRCRGPPRPRAPWQALSFRAILPSFSFPFEGAQRVRRKREGRDADFRSHRGAAGCG
ncbi:sigma-70 family RNA polymerase sigma factor [Mesorhizobium sp. M0078]|uniref:sigma-70 family RNA polymerase sigma factor n=1 Tax=Mesorhizobium sp. M0078 TaxID=2956871 RepID=UPI00333608B9